ncbi:MAG: Dam family site-specific DNA-(adenine-N6)-methyltransferase [Gammaproteobacteria bacterium]|nr:Dam family site-specific DNA-(adenine-N6)-methyltransferase [Gammaproteobacteria bacterium]
MYQGRTDINTTNTRPFLKWPGGKYRLINKIREALSDGRRLIEPFTGSGAVFLNTDYEDYLLADSNPDLITLYQQLSDEGKSFIRYCQKFFSQQNNSKQIYYRYRDEFNTTSRLRRKSALFLYLNRHCYNGLVRYNKSGEFNTPFGLHKSPYFPEKEMKKFCNAAKKAEFINQNFKECLGNATRGDIVYCDPPYAPLSKTANFTDYHSDGFNWEDQLELAEIAGKLAGEGVKVVVSNHDVPQIKSLYQSCGANIQQFTVQRMISSDTANRGRAGELIATFG